MPQGEFSRVDRLEPGVKQSEVLTNDVSEAFVDAILHFPQNNYGISLLVARSLLKGGKKAGDIALRQLSEAWVQKAGSAMDNGHYSHRIPAATAEGIGRANELFATINAHREAEGLSPVTIELITPERIQKLWEHFRSRILVLLYAISGAGVDPQHGAPRGSMNVEVQFAVGIDSALRDPLRRAQSLAMLEILLEELHLQKKDIKRAVSYRREPLMDEFRKDEKRAAGKALYYAAAVDGFARLKTEFSEARDWDDAYIRQLISHIT